MAVSYREVLERHGLSRKVGEVGDGWAEIVDAALSDLLRAGIEVRRIKVLHGRIRFGIAASEDQMAEAAEVLAEAERRSARTCEYCGAEGSLQRLAGSERTVCGDCLEAGGRGLAYEAREAQRREDAIRTLGGVRRGIEE